MNKNSIKVIDLFCGAGGFSEGFRQAGFEIILGVDSWGDAIKSYRGNQNCDGWEREIEDIDLLPPCDVIIGSPPCQCFSEMNEKRKNRKGSDLDKEGLKLVREFERIVKRNNPAFWVWENVENVKRLYPSAFIINAFDVGVPQKRKRAFIANFSFFRQSYKKGALTPVYGYVGALATNKGKMAIRHHGQSRTVTGSRIRNLETNKYLDMKDVKELMGFPREYYLYGGVTSQQQQLGNAVCPPVAKIIAEGILAQI